MWILSCLIYAQNSQKWLRPQALFFSKPIFLLLFPYFPFSLHSNHIEGIDNLEIKQCESSSWKVCGRGKIIFFYPALLSYNCHSISNRNIIENIIPHHLPHPNSNGFLYIVSHPIVLVLGIINPKTVGCVHMGDQQVDF